MKLRFPLLSLFCVIGFAVSAQQDTYLKYNIGVAAPPLRVLCWIKGTPIQNFEKGKVYVVDFWATWCAPCRAAMPHTSHLARKYRNKVTFAAVDVYEASGTKPVTAARIKAFVDGMGRRMDFSVAMEDTSYTVRHWLAAFGVEAIPTSFVINGEGRIAWIGHPRNLDTVLRKVLNNTLNSKEAATRRAYNYHLEKLDDEVNDKVHPYQDGFAPLIRIGNPDSTLFVINEMVKKEPDLKYAPSIASYTFSALMITDQQKAYDYGKQVMVTSTYETPAWDVLIDDIRACIGKMNIRPEIYRLGAECYQAVIDHTVYPQTFNMGEKYYNMADWYRLAGDKKKAIRALRKAIRFYRKNK
jgi:thiol-disulfide isomerase/thioredoxin